MSERWERYSDGTRVLDTAIGLFEVCCRGASVFLWNESTGRVNLRAKKLGTSAITEAERIIRDRCRETLKLLGE